MFSQANKSASDSIENQLRLPSFVTASELNDQSIRGRFEFFMGAKNSGLNVRSVSSFCSLPFSVSFKAHTDPQCQWIMTSQFSGKKNWRLGVSINLRLFEQLNPTFV
jgi:hypothetical protein